MHGSFLYCEFVQAQLWGTPKFLKAIDEAFAGTHGILQEQWEKRQYQLPLSGQLYVSYKYNVSWAVGLAKLSSFHDYRNKLLLYSRICFDYWSTTVWSIRPGPFFPMPNIHSYLHLLPLVQRYWFHHKSVLTTAWEQWITWATRLFPFAESAVFPV